MVVSLERSCYRPADKFGFTTIWQQWLLLTTTGMCSISARTHWCTPLWAEICARQCFAAQSFGVSRSIDCGCRWNISSRKESLYMKSMARGMQYCHKWHASS